MTESYLEMMEESLKQKIEVLQSIEKENMIQKDILENTEHFDEEGFNATINRKGELIRRIEQLNDGFETLFDRVKKELDGNREKYKDQIRIYQEMIRTITDISNTIEVEERRNREMVRNYFDGAKGQINQNRRSNQAAYNYYQTMNKSRITPPQFYDTKN